MEVDKKSKHTIVEELHKQFIQLVKNKDGKDIKRLKEVTKILLSISNNSEWLPHYRNVNTICKAMLLTDSATRRINKRIEQLKELVKDKPWPKLKT